MKAIAVTQRVEIVAAHGERGDCRDQAWTRFLAACGLLPLWLPNVTESRWLCARTWPSAALYENMVMAGELVLEDALES